MKFFSFQKILQLVTNLQFAILLLALIAFFSSVGSIIEQDELLSFYQQNYPITKPLFGFFTWQVIFFFGLNHLYTTSWFYFLLFLLSFSLVSCTFTRQFPLFVTSKKYTFQKEKRSFFSLPFFVQCPNFYYTQEYFIGLFQKLNFFLYQKQQVIYASKGLVGRISPILVHFSLLLVLGGAFFSSFYNFKAQELLPKGELFHVQNPIHIGNFTSLPSFSIRVNDFWVEYQSNKFVKPLLVQNLNFVQKNKKESVAQQIASQKNLKEKEIRVHQFYSNLSILNQQGDEILSKTISVNNPLRYQGIDIYQSDWNLIALRLQTQPQSLLTNKKTNIIELPFFSIQKKSKSWLTWLFSSTSSNIFPVTLVFDQFQNTLGLYNSDGKFMELKTLGDSFQQYSDIKFIDILSSTGLLLKYDPTIPIIYTGFGFLMITTSLSYLPFTQFWMCTSSSSIFWLGCITNRGKIALEIEFENLLRLFENQIKKSQFLFFPLKIKTTPFTNTKL